jgi:hypothetical protein
VLFTGALVGFVAGALEALVDLLVVLAGEVLGLVYEAHGASFRSGGVHTPSGLP